jgi:two-component system CheB/CheR fusion protein
LRSRPQLENGAQVITHIRQTFSRAIPGILITGDTAPERIREAHDHGFTLLHKPVEPARLHAAIAENLSRQASNGVRSGG